MKDHVDDHDDFGGLQRDLATVAARRTLLGRRRAMQTLGLAGSGTLIGACDKSSPTSPTTTTTTTATTTTTDASLSNLVLSAGSFSPAFAAATTSYTLSVANSVATTTVTATVTASAATVRVNGTLVTSGAASVAISLAVGDTQIAVLVTAADGSTTRTYVLTVTRSSTVTSACSGRIPQETAGPYPGDGSNGANALIISGIVRSDIRSSAAASGTAEGVPLSIVLTLVSATTCSPLVGYAVYLWHCTRDGLYSLYSSGITNQDYLRGVQQTDANGRVTFTSIFPGCYSGRWPHIHFEVYPSLAVATSAANKIATSQLAMPKAACDEVYATTGYSTSVRNLAGVTLASDNVFSDGSSLQLATTSGTVSGGYTATLTVGI